MESRYQYSFEKLEVWKKSKEFVKYIYKVIESFPDEEKYNLISQLKRASISIVSNIAEGTSRSSLRDQMRFVEIAYGSTIEVYCQLILSHELGFLSTENLEIGKIYLNEITKMLSSLKKSQLQRLTLSPKL